MLKRSHQILATVVALAVVSFTSAAVLAKEGVPTTKAGHLALAAKYEKMASEQRGVVREHTQMKRDYKANQASLPKQTREKSLAEMDKHCDAIIANAKSQSDEYKALVRWHKMRASELK